MPRAPMAAISQHRNPLLPVERFVGNAGDPQADDPGGADRLEDDEPRQEGPRRGAFRRRRDRSRQPAVVRAGRLARLVAQGAQSRPDGGNERLSVLHLHRAEDPLESYALPSTSGRSDRPSIRSLAKAAIFKGPFLPAWLTRSYNLNASICGRHGPGTNGDQPRCKRPRIAYRPLFSIGAFACHYRIVNLTISCSQGIALECPATS